MPNSLIFSVGDDGLASLSRLGGPLQSKNLSFAARSPVFIFDVLIQASPEHPSKIKTDHQRVWFLCCGG